MSASIRTRTPDPSWLLLDDELFDQQDSTYRKEVLGPGLRIAVEAASPFGWTRYVRSEDDVVGMSGFGASGAYEELYKHFGITAERIVDLVRRRL